MKSYSFCSQFEKLKLVKENFSKEIDEKPLKKFLQNYIDFEKEKVIEISCYRRPYYLIEYDDKELFSFKIYSPADKLAICGKLK